MASSSRKNSRKIIKKFYKKTDNMEEKILSKPSTNANLLNAKSET